MALLFPFPETLLTAMTPIGQLFFRTHRSHEGYPPPKDGDFSRAPSLGYSARRDDYRRLSPPLPRAARVPSHISEPDPPAHNDDDDDGRKPDQHAAPPPHREGYDYSYASDKYDRPKLDDISASHAPSRLPTYESLKNNNQKTLEGLLALWAPLPAGKGHSLLES
ncbi:MAG: hypothetical protein Q9161_005397 [Pseudevernia consocians]